MKPPAYSTNGPEVVCISPSEFSTDFLETVPSVFSAAGEDEVGEGPFAYGPLGHDFIQAFFPELGSDFPLSA